MGRDCLMATEFPFGMMEMFWNQIVVVVAQFCESSFFLYKFIYFILFILFLAVLCLRCYMRAFLWMRRAGATLHCGAQASRCGDFSCCRARALAARASVVVAHRLSSCGSRALEHRLSSCGTRAQLLCGTWDLPRPGLEPMSPALVGGFLTTAPPGKPCECS